MNAAFSEDNKPSGSTCMEEGGAINLGDGLVAWDEEDSVGDSRTVRCAWHKWSFSWTSKGSLVLLRSLSLLSMDWTMSGVSRFEVTRRHQIHTGLDSWCRIFKQL